MVARALCGQGYEEAKAYIQRFVAMPTQQVDGNDPRYVRGMYGVMGLALARMECRLDDTEACDQSKALLCVLAVLPARGIPLELFEQMEQTELAYCELFTPSGFNNAVAPLLAEDLVAQQPDGKIDVHSMVQHSCRALLQDQPVHAAVSTLGKMFLERFVHNGWKSKEYSRRLIG